MERSTALPADSRHVCFSSMVISVGRSMIDVRFDSLVLVFFSETEMNATCVVVGVARCGATDVNEQNGKWRETDADSATFRTQTIINKNIRIDM